MDKLEEYTGCIDWRNTLDAYVNWMDRINEHDQRNVSVAFAVQNYILKTKRFSTPTQPPSPSAHHAGCKVFVPALEDGQWT